MFEKIFVLTKNKNIQITPLFYVSRSEPTDIHMWNENFIMKFIKELCFLNMILQKKIDWFFECGQRYHF